MSKKQHTNTSSNGEHGTTSSYVVGFILSLVFTFVPYYLVTGHVLSGSALLATILVFAVLQMLVQIIFFLHLGRERKPRWNLIFFIQTVAVILLVVVASLWIMHHLHYNMTPVTREDASKKLIEDEGIGQIGGEKTGACIGTHTTHKVIIKDGRVSPVHTDAKACDMLTFINEDDATREMTFGTHPHHGVYAGESELSVRKGRPQSITLSETGTYQFHDHLDADAAGTFTVEP